MPTNTTSLDFSPIAKKHFCIDNDESRSFDLDTSDLTIINRLNDGINRLNDCEIHVQAILDGVNLTEDEDLHDYKLIGDRLAAVDKEMRSIIDYIFDAPVSAACAPSGSMFDPFGGQFRFEFIIDVLVQQYSDNVNAEYKKMDERLKKHTQKYKKG